MEYTISEIDPLIGYLPQPTIICSGTHNSITKWKNKCILENGVFIKLLDSRYILSIFQYNLVGLWDINLENGVISNSRFNGSSLYEGNVEYYGIPANAISKNNTRLLTPESSKIYRVEELAKELLMIMIGQKDYKNVEATVLTVKAIKIADSFISNLSDYKTLNK